MSEDRRSSSSPPLSPPPPSPPSSILAELPEQARREPVDRHQTIVLFFRRSALQARRKLLLDKQ